MKYKILSILCVLCLLTGCKVELPQQQDKNSSALSSTSSSSAASEQGESAAVSSVASSQDTATSNVVSAASPSKSTSQVSSKSSSSKQAASKAPSAAKQSSTVAAQNCSLSISCSDILKNKDKFSAEQLSVVHNNDGLIYQASGIAFKDGETVYDVLVRELKAKNINVDHATSPLYGAIYINGIDNIYQKDFGSNSGWLYAVNGIQPPVGCSNRKLKSGDKIQWIYACNQ